MRVDAQDLGGRKQGLAKGDARGAKWEGGGQIRGTGRDQKVEVKLAEKGKYRDLHRTRIGASMAGGGSYNLRLVGGR